MLGEGVGAFASIEPKQQIRCNLVKFSLWGDFAGDSQAKVLQYFSGNTQGRNLGGLSPRPSRVSYELQAFRLAVLIAPVAKGTPTSSLAVLRRFWGLLDLADRANGHHHQNHPQGGNMTDEEKSTPEEDLRYFVDVHLPRKRETMLALLGELIKDGREALRGMSYCTFAETKDKSNIVLTLYVNYGFCSLDKNRGFVDRLAGLMDDTEIEERDLDPEIKRMILAELLGDDLLTKLLAHKRGTVDPV